MAATWYSDAVIVPDGRLVDYVHMGYGPPHAHYRVYRIARGRVLEALSMGAEQFRVWRERKFRRSDRPRSTAKPWPPPAGRAAA